MAGEVALRFGQRLKQRRSELGLKQREVAERMGGAVTKQHISDWERGYNEPSDRYKLQLVDALDVGDVSWFYENAKKETPDAMSALDDGSQLDRIEKKLDRLTRLLTGVQDGEDPDRKTIALLEDLPHRVAAAAGSRSSRAAGRSANPPADGQHKT